MVEKFPSPEIAKRNASANNRANLDLESEKVKKRRKEEIRKFHLSLFKETDSFPDTLKIGFLKARGFDVNEKLSQVKGSFVEIGGPTPKGFALVDIDKLPKKLSTSNINTFGNIGTPDFLADAKNMPLRNNSVGALFSRHFSGTNYLEEAWRIIEPGGIYICEGGSGIIFKPARKMGFNVVQYEVTQGKDSFYCHFIFEKPKEGRNKTQ